MKTSNDYIQGIVDNILLQTYISMLNKGGVTLNKDGRINFYSELGSPYKWHAYCKCEVEPKLQEYPAVYAHVKYGGFNIGTICIANIQGKMFRGASLCSPEDQFSKKVGREIAYRRAYESAVTDKEPLDIPAEYMNVFVETNDYLMEIAKNKLFDGKDPFEKHEVEEIRYPYIAEFNTDDTNSFKGMKVVFISKNKGYVMYQPDKSAVYFITDGKIKEFTAQNYKKL